MVEFENNNSITVEHTFQVDDRQRSKKVMYDMIIGNDLMWNMGIDISFSKELIEWNDDAILLKRYGTIQNVDVCEMLYSIHTDSPILQEAEERQNCILDSDYSKVDIASMVAGLEITETSKVKLKNTLEKFPELFGGGLGKLKNCKPATIKLKEGSKPYAGLFYKFPQAYVKSAKKEIQRMVDVGILKKLRWDNDSPWCAPSFGVPKKTQDIRIVTNFRKMNACIERHPFPLPRILDQQQRLEKF